MKSFYPDFLALSKIEEDLLVNKLDAARKAISHAGEKGRSLEAEVMTLLRSFLPGEYGLTTGFVVYHTVNGPNLSPQLDVIIYDAVRCGPITRLATCDVLPLEAVYGYVEVKASLQSSSNSAIESANNSIEKCIQTNQLLRGMTERRFWVPVESSSVQAELKATNWMAIRSYVFALDAQGVDMQALNAWPMFQQVLGSPFICTECLSLDMGIIELERLTLIKPNRRTGTTLTIQVIKP